MKYQVERTDLFDIQLREIFLRIDNNFGADVALSVLDELEKAFSILSSFPYSGHEPRYEVLLQRKFRVMTLKKNLVFYKVDDQNKTITVYAIVDQRTEYLDIIMSL